MEELRKRIRRSPTLLSYPVSRFAILARDPFLNSLVDERDATRPRLDTVCDPFTRDLFGDRCCVRLFNSWLATSFNGLGPVFFYFLLSKRVLAGVKFALGAHVTRSPLSFSLFCPPSSSLTLSLSLSSRRGPVARL